MIAIRRLVETVRRLRPSQVGHRVVRRIEHALARFQARGPAPWSAWSGVAALPREVRRPLGFPFDRPDGDGFRFAGTRARLEAGALAWEGEPSALSRYHAGYAEVVRSLAESGDLSRARAWLAALVGASPDHPYVRSRRVVALVDARAAGLVEADATIVADAASVARRPEWDVRGNHLIANGAALFRAGAAFRGAAARRWRALGASILSTCVRDQVLADGVHYERSPVYQAIVLEHLLLVLETCAARGEAPPAGVEAAAAGLAVALAELSLPDGLSVRWRDGAPGMALATESLVAWAARRAGPLSAPRRGPRAFPHAGFAIVESADGKTAATLVGAPPCPLDLPAHGHADALSYELVLGGRRIVAAAGTSDYAAGASRDRDRRPGAFAGVLLDGAAPADAYDAFRVGARAWVRRLETGEIKGWRSACASAGGFPGVPGVTVRRTIAISPRGTVVVMDEWSGEGAHRVEALAPLGVGLVAAPSASGAAIGDEGRAFALSTTGARVSLESGEFAVALGATVPRSVLRMQFDVQLPARVLHAYSQGSEPLAIEVAPGYGNEVRVRLRRAGDFVRDVEVGYLPIGFPA